MTARRDAQAEVGELLHQLTDPEASRSLRLRLRLDVIGWRQEEKTELQTEIDRRGASAPAAAEPAASSLDDLGISDPSRGNPADPHPPELVTPRALYLPPSHPLAEVEAETEGHRQNRAARHRHAAREALRGLRDVGEDFDRDVEACAPQRTPTERLDWPTFRRKVVVTGNQQLAVGRDEQERDEMKHAAARSLRWHRGREKGQLERFDRVTQCGKRRVHTRCLACNASHEVPDRCGCGRLCFACRMSERAHRISRLALAQTRVFAQARKLDLLRGHARWSEKMITLTVPHVMAPESGWYADSHGPNATVKLRVEAIFKAWRSFSVQLQKWARRTAKRLKLPKGRGVVWYRSFEWTPGGDGMGHPHFHLWIFCPFLPVEELREWWRCALAGVGIVTPDVIVDIRPARRGNGSSIRAEVAKGTITLEAPDGTTTTEYINKFSIVDLLEPDAEGHRARVPAATIARLYEALDGRRMVATSPRLLNPRHAGCQDCGSVGWMRTEIVEQKPGSSTPGACGTLQAPARSPP